MAKRPRETHTDRDAKGASDDESKNRAKRSRSSSTTPDTAIKDLNALSPDEFGARLLNVALRRLNTEHPQLHATFKTAPELTTAELNACYSMIEQTSRADYEASSWGWHPRRKKREMREPELRYILIREQCASSSPTHPTYETGLAGFLSFMLTHDSTPAVPVVYIYEIHLAESVRGRRLGLQLMRLANHVAERAGVEKLMLTCFLSNSTAHNFYRRLGYSTDESSPEDRKTRNSVVKADYVIMSKRPAMMS